MKSYGSSTLGRFLVLSFLTSSAAAPAGALLSVVETLQDVPMWGAVDLAVSGDDRFVYALGGSALAVFERDAASGLPSLVKVYLDGRGGIVGIDSAATMFLSPDDRFLYVGGGRAPDAAGVERWALTIFERDPADGTLRLADVLTADFDFRVRLALSPDGAHLYAASVADHAVLVFARDPADGGLSFSGATSEGIDGEAYELFPALDREGRFLYLAEQRPAAGQDYYVDRLLVYARDAVTGALTFVEAQVNHSRRVRDMDRPVDVVVSLDDANVYVVNAALFPFDGYGGAIVGFRRDASTGRLAFIGPQEYFSTVPTTAVWSHDGAVLYAAGVAGGMFETVSEVRVYSRRTPSGRLRQVWTVQEANVDVRRPGVHAMAISGDGRFLYTSAYNGKLLNVWERRAHGGLRAVKDPHDPTHGRGALRGAARAAVSPDGRHVYVTSGGSGGLAIYERDPETGRLAFLRLTVRDGPRIGPVTVSADGHWVYALQTVFARHATSGLLSPVGQAQPWWQYLDGDDFAPSADGRHLYVPQGGAYPDRPIDGYLQDANGRLQRLDLDVPRWPGRGPLVTVRTAAVTADGAYVLAVGRFRGKPATGDETDALCAFARDADSGGLTLQAVAGIGPATDGGQRLAVAGNGRHVYVVDPATDSLLVFALKRAAKSLRLVQRHVDGLDGVAGLDEPRDVAISPSGYLVYVVSRGSETVTAFARDKESGALTFVAAERGGPEGDDLLFRPDTLAVSPEGRHVYVTSGQASALTVLALDGP